MRLINRSSCRTPETGSYLYHNRWGVQNQVRLIIILLACLYSHLALFQLVGASTQSSLSLRHGNGDVGLSPTYGSRGQAVITSVPEKDRGRFVLYHLAKALNSTTTNESAILPRLQLEPETPQKKSQTFKDIRTYNTFSTDLLKWTMRTFEWSRYDVSRLLRRRRVLCTSKGLCFNPKDIGAMCCPF